MDARAIGYVYHLHIFNFGAINRMQMTGNVIRHIEQEGVETGKANLQVKTEYT